MSDHRRPKLRAGLVAAAAVAVGAIAYGVDLALTDDKVARGVTVAGVQVGGLEVDEADRRLRSVLDDRARTPLPVRAGTASTELVPARAGLAVDWDATLARLGARQWNPLTRLSSFFGEREVEVVTRTDQRALARALDGLGKQIDSDPVEGDVVFRGAEAVPILPKAGQRLIDDAAARQLRGSWAEGTPVDLPVESLTPAVSERSVQSALAQVARPAVAGAVRVSGKDGVVATIVPGQVRRVLDFEADDSGDLVPRFDTEAAIALLRPQLARTETAPRDARVRLVSGAPQVTPHADGETIDWRKTLEFLPELFSATGTRTAAAKYVTAPAKVTTQQAEALGIDEVIAEYTTGGFSYASGVNIRLVAEEVDGAVVGPGETFSLNGYTGPRGRSEGYVPSGIINNGHADEAVGGGISQFATTLYNAAYFAGLDDVEHTEHSYYISRYPAAREATVFEGAIDLKFRNPSRTGVLIETIGTGSDITVRLWGTKNVDVESITGDRHSYTQPRSLSLTGGTCSPSSGAQGFTTSDTRVVTDRGTGAEISRRTRTVTYDPAPIVTCR
ncbi:VanW family protein [Speluncibacter jeojiensis]|uniref:VanW family protein n=1 Tax=Speluncibacter jeojiensis TaxID=2710754 RepID=A0A9X4M2R9_9ACTN|nr:VanW family protein [Corynebacteriales bacterium D3-21]